MQTTVIEPKPLSWTGERYLPEVTGQVALEHIHRYLLAQEYAAGKDVLDIACGEGYGTAMLAKVARSAVGMDIDQTTIAHASARYNLANVRFEQASCIKIPVEDDSFDLIISFETLEHVEDHHAMLAEIRRVLRPHGILIISTPDKQEYSVAHNYQNPFHVRELFRHEFQALLQAFFVNYSLLRQQLVYGSVIFPETADARIVSYDIEDTTQPIQGNLKARYMLAIASDDPLPQTAGGVLEQEVRESEPVKDWIARYEEAMELLHKSEKQRGNIEDQIRREKADSAQVELRLLQQLTHWRTTLRNSLAWRVFCLLRRLKDSVVGLIRNPFFLADYYSSQLPPGALGNLSPYQHYQLVGWRRGYNPHPYFNVRWYLDHYPEVAAQGVEPLDHYLTKGWKIGCDPNQYFDVRWYLTQYPEVAKAGIEPLQHYATKGWRAKKSPGPNFDSEWYLVTYPDVEAQDIDPLLHYVRSGCAERRFPSSLDKELATLRHGPHARWIDAQCRSFSIPEAELPPIEDRVSAALGDLQSAAANVARSQAPEVSIVIAVHNKVTFTLASITAILLSKPKLTFEIIVVDDVSTDQTPQIFGQIPANVVYIRSDTNNGFLKSCNSAAQRARGKYIVLLNNDTIVFPDWLDSLIETLKSQPDAGIVGSKLLYPNGRLQEAGGLIWSDAAGWNFGRGDDPNRPQYNYLREVDYCSGCSVAISKSLWDALAGFDDRYAPAYYEDADICFRAREMGKKVFYQPLSKLIHFEGVSSGTSTSAGIKAYQETNRTTFLQRWGKILAGHGGPDSLLTAVDRYSKGRILVVDACTPTPDRDAGSLLMLNLLRIFRMNGRSVVFLPANLILVDEYTRQLQQMGIQCGGYPHFRSLHEAIIHYAPSAEFAVLCRTNVASTVINAVRIHGPQAKVIFHTIDLHCLREFREAMLYGARSLRDKAAHTEIEELDTIRKSDATIVVSQAEQALLLDLVPEARVYLIGLIHEVPIAVAGATFDSRQDILFVGGFDHTPNVDAVIYFVTEIWPLLCQMGYGGRFIIVGSKMPAKIKMLTDERIIAKGYVEDLSQEFARVRVSVAPLQYGAGLKGKVASSLGYGVPCVATRVAVEGSGLTEGTGVLLGTTPRDLASKIFLLYSDENLWTRTAKSGKDYFLAHYSLAAVDQKVNRMLSELGGAASLDTVSAASSAS